MLTLLAFVMAMMRSSMQSLSWPQQAGLDSFDSLNEPVAVVVCTESFKIEKGSCLRFDVRFITWSLLRRYTP